MIPYTTLKRLRSAGACKDRYAHLRKALGENYGDDTKIKIVKIVETNGLDDALWVPEHIISGSLLNKRYRLFAVACCQDILHLMEDQRSIDAVKTAHLFAHGEVDYAAMAAAWAAARAAARAASWDAARAAARDAARAAARDAARAAAWDAERAAERAAAAAWDAAWDAAMAAERDAAMGRFADQFKIIFGAGYV